MLHIQYNNYNTNYHLWDVYHVPGTTVLSKHLHSW